MKTLTVAAVLVTALAACTSAPPAATPSTPLGQVRLVSYSGCDELLAGLREKAAANVGPWGFAGAPIMYMEDASAARDSAVKQTPDHSTTNVHEAGVDEPDLVKTDGDRVFTVGGGVLRVIDAATRKVTASLDLGTGDRGYAPADLLVSGDRALVLLQGGGMVTSRVADGFAPPGETRYVLVDLAGEPKVIGSIKPEGVHVDARMVGSTVRLVTRGQPDIAFPEAKENVSEAERKAVNQAVVRGAPLTAWLPEIEVTDASGAVRKTSVPCERVSHPADYTGTSLLTLHTLDLAQGVTAAGSDPIALAADGDIVYGTGGSLYVASNPRWWWPIERGAAEQAPATEPAPDEPTPSVPPEETEVHRFDVSGPGAPSYAASGKVPGRLLNQYSLSEHDGHLRVATTLGSADGGTSSSSVHVLDAATMKTTGQVGGLGKGERIYSVRFIGPVGYVVTFRQVDPLYTLDLRDPAAPKVTGELKITGYSAYLHPAGDGRLIGVGQEASGEGRTLGTQVSLFDVSDPASPRRLSQLFQKDSGSEAEWDPHAFLYWPKTGTAVIPLSSHAGGKFETGATVLKITDSEVTRTGTIEHPSRTEQDYTYQPGIQRSMVIGESIWTFSYEGAQVNDLATLAKQAWIPLGS
ncbi:beta-propeller domain-containing protein [Nonomuraea sp. MCN248]|uniref:Beta-propeller domain-containing protein n=1 Tax=Nonomuraea corallina TaxID=2989783 RepID=A0ABT4S5P7_9ACTN|nr:beta-propeller domain-containing protein [Nonomuraea corallina]MDA0632514.1 beta-propeller domain-containing protein [Nonomuraea corallina]